MTQEAELILFHAYEHENGDLEIPSLAFIAATEITIKKMGRIIAPQ